MTMDDGTTVVLNRDESPGLRERKKRETARAIEVAALELADAHPLSEVTIDAIAQRADVTSRTFFNYFGSKDDAVLGISKAFHIEVRGLIRPVEGESLLDAVVRAVVEQFQRFDVGTPEFQAMRRRVLVENPALLVRHVETMSIVESELVAELSLLLAERNVDDPAVREERAWAIVIAGGSVARLALHTWSHESGSRRTLAEHTLAAYETVLSVSRHGD